MTVAPILIFGAGRTGRGFIGHLCARNNVPVILIDTNDELIGALRQTGRYYVNVMGAEHKSAEVSPVCSMLLRSGQDCPWQAEFNKAALCFTAVGGNNLPALAQALAPALKRRFESGDIPLNIVTCENLTGAAEVLRQSIFKETEDTDTRRRLKERVGFVEAMVLKTCVTPEREQRLAGPLQVDAENFFDLPCDGDAFLGTPPLEELKLLPGFKNQLRRKIYTYNCINAVIVYVGAARGYTILSDAANDREIALAARAAGEEASRALIAEYGFDANDQRQWVESALRKFADPVIADSIQRNGADTVRKLGREDRLIGPALLALKHDIEPHAISAGIFSALEFRDDGQPSLLEKFSGNLNRILSEVCSLGPDEQLSAYLLALRKR